MRSDINEKANASVSVDASVTHGQANWVYFYVALGFWLTIWGTIIQMITPLKFPWNLIAYVVFIVFSFWLFLTGWFHTKLIGIKNWYEGKAR
jgi:hypothetical protein